MTKHDRMSMALILLIVFCNPQASFMLQLPQL